MTADLAKPGEPYVTDRGHIVAKDERMERDIRQSDRFVPVIRKMQINNKFNIGEMPSSDINQQHAINVILVYHLHGLTVQEIAYILKFDPIEIQNIIHSTDFQITFENIFRELINVNSNSIKAKIADYSSIAVTNIIQLAETADKDIVKLKANQDLLDRAGFAAEQLYDSGSTADDADVLKIVVENGHADRTTVSVNLKGAKK